MRHFFSRAFSQSTRRSASSGRSSFQRHSPSPNCKPTAFSSAFFQHRPTAQQPNRFASTSAAAGGLGARAASGLGAAAADAAGLAEAGAASTGGSSCGQHSRNGGGVSGEPLDGDSKSEKPCNPTPDPTKSPPMPRVSPIHGVKGRRSHLHAIPQSIYDQTVCNIMRRGEKAKARALVDRALEEAARLVAKHNREAEQDDATIPITLPVEMLEKAVMECAPLVKLVGERRGAKIIQIPRPLTERSKRRAAIMWMVTASKAGGGRPNDFSDRLGLEIYKILTGSGSLSKRDELHRQALANRSNVVMFDRRK
ncbi:MAG: hypothetical protein SGCHY_005583 [Lobulomycetales sp.]